MGDRENNANIRNILRYWWMLELFSPQSVPKPTKHLTNQDSSRVIEWRPGNALPWQTLTPPSPIGKCQRRWQHTVYLGVYKLEDIYHRLHQAFGEDSDAYDEGQPGRSACAGVLFNERGELVSGSAVLSSALWAVGQISDGALKRGDEWAEGFPAAAKSFTELVDAIDVNRCQTGAELPEPYNANSLYILLRLAHQAAGVAENEKLATGKIIIKSDPVPERSSDDFPVDSDFLNSYFLDELALVQRDIVSNQCPSALAAYLTNDNSTSEDSRIDVITEPQIVNDRVRIERLPKGRWPSNPEHPLALRQQFAVNQALDDLGNTRGMMSVNGPPGTGKTTMLRDIVAGNVVERARRLASLARPEDAFTTVIHSWESEDGFRRNIRQLRKELVGFEMVLASANNAAVENVSFEIPARSAIAKQWRDEADYFADIASAALTATRGNASADDSDLPPDSDRAPSKAWGLVAARLGNKKNRNNFRSAFWFDKIDHQTKAMITPRMQTRLKRWQSGEVPHRNWEEAKSSFQLAERRVDELIDRRRSAQARLDSLPSAIARESSLALELQQLNSAVVATDFAIQAEKERFIQAETEYADAVEARSQHIETKPGLLETLFSLGRTVRVWRSSLEPLEETLIAARNRRQNSIRALEHLNQQAQNIQIDILRVAESRAEAANALKEIRRCIAIDRETYPIGYPGENWDGKSRELRAPWLDPELDEARSMLFLAALRLHEDFLANAAKEMLVSLRAAIEVVAGVSPPSLTPEKVLAAWQTFFLVVPLVSTTFHSFGRMFARVGRDSLGWLFVDEAGQASPQYAVGAIWRSQRVVVVGDPLQLEPVVTIPSKASRDIATAYQVTQTWIPPRGSVQTLADRISKYGTLFKQSDRSVWVSSPLTVHRRSDEPMFSLFNEIAYNGIMVNGVNRHHRHQDKPDVYDDKSGLGVAPSQWFDEPALTRGSHLQTNQIYRFELELNRLQEQNISMSDIIAISPFRLMADRLGEIGDRYPGLRAGTIHKAQGREADIVFLVLGGDPSSPGAKAWASSTVNLVNVAASRAKRRLYVIGDRNDWARYNYFQQLSSVLSWNASSDD